MLREQLLEVRGTLMPIHHRFLSYLLMRRPGRPPGRSRFGHHTIAVGDVSDVSGFPFSLNAPFALLHTEKPSGERARA